MPQKPKGFYWSQGSTDKQLKSAQKRLRSWAYVRPRRSKWRPDLKSAWNSGPNTDSPCFAMQFYVKMKYPTVDICLSKCDTCKNSLVHLLHLCSFFFKWTVLRWLIKFTCNENDVSQRLHLWFWFWIFSCTDFTCLFRVELFINDLPQESHLWFLMFSWTCLIWRVRVSLPAKFLLHDSQMKSFLSWWIEEICLSKWNLLRNSLSQDSHLKSLFFSKSWPCWNSVIL